MGLDRPEAVNEIYLLTYCVDSNTLIKVLIHIICVLAIMI